MGKNKSTKSDGVAMVDNKTQKLEEIKKMPKGSFKPNKQSPK